MWIRRLSVQHLRNLSRVNLAPVPGANILCGPNASGKTSLLESLSLLSTSRSFRTPHSLELIQRQQSALTVFAQVSQENETDHQLGLERSRQQTRLKLDGQVVNQTSALARHLPLQIMHPAGIQLLDQGPKFRRQFLDWGVFHVEPNYLQQWRQYARNLKQRNAVLRQRDLRTLPQWDEQLSLLAVAIHQVRQQYVANLHEILPDCYRLLLNLDDLDIDYRPGWDVSQSLARILARVRGKDSQLGHTTVGPHRADLVFLSQGEPVQKVFSRGQLKLFICALHLAQARIFFQRRQQACIFLLDDLASELDATSRARLMGQLAQLGSQVFVTGIDVASIPLDGWDSQRVFHVERGEIKDVV
jgi:DNA replication and repair protein RecF